MRHRTQGYRDRNAPEGVVNDFVQREHADGIRTRRTIDGHADDGIRRDDVLAAHLTVDRFDRRARDNLRIVNRGDHIAMKLTRDDGTDIDGGRFKGEAVRRRVLPVAGRSVTVCFERGDYDHREDRDAKNRGEHKHPAAGTKRQRSVRSGRGRRVGHGGRIVRRSHVSIVCTRIKKRPAPKGPAAENQFVSLSL